MPSGGRCSRRACGRQQLPTARHQPGGTGSVGQAVVGAQAVLAGGSSSQLPGLTVRVGGLVTRLGGRGAVLKEGPRGTVTPTGPGSPA